jgi:hypothetical protein
MDFLRNGIWDIGEVNARTLEVTITAALAAERERLERKWKASMVDVTTLIQNLEKQLAAERKEKERIEFQNVTFDATKGVLTVKP